MKPTTEIWKPIPAFEGLYEASSSGRIRSLDRITAHGTTRKGRVLKGHRHPDGHLADDAIRAAVPHLRAAWAEEIRAIEVPAHNLHDQLPSDHWYAGQKIMRDEIAALLEGGAE